MSDDRRGSAEAKTTMRRLQHDLRTPLGQIIGYSEMLQEEAADRDQGDLIPDLEKIRNAARSLLEFVDGVFRPQADPRDAIATEPAAAEEPSQTPDAARAAACGCLLVVDDDPQNRDMLARRLERAGYAVRTAEDGRIALRLVEDRAIDLVLLDVVMPGMGGLDVLKVIRQTRSVSDLPVIMATALDRSEDTVAALGQGANDYVTKPFDLPVVLARVETQLSLKRAAREIETLVQQLEIRNAFIRQTFGRFHSDEIVARLLDTPEGLDLRGEKRRVTILIADLCGFSSMTEALSPTAVVSVLNNFLGTMCEVVLAHQGTIDEFIGDQILALFGAPIGRDNDAERAVACAIAMQVAMESVNDRSRSQGLPQVEMGVGIATGDVIVGNIGSEKRLKYDAIGSAVNLAARIESYTTGGEILISQATLEEAKSVTRIDLEREVHPKGFAGPVRIHRVAGISGSYNLVVPKSAEVFVELEDEVLIRFSVLDEKRVVGSPRLGRIAGLSATGARIRSVSPVLETCDVRIELLDAQGEPIPGDSYAKVVVPSANPGGNFTVRFSAQSLRVAAALKALLAGIPNP